MNARREKCFLWGDFLSIKEIFHLENTPKKRHAKNLLSKTDFYHATIFSTIELEDQKLYHTFDWAWNVGLKGVGMVKFISTLANLLKKNYKLPAL